MLSRTYLNNDDRSEITGQNLIMCCVRPRLTPDPTPAGGGRLWPGASELAPRDAHPVERTEPEPEGGHCGSVQPSQNTTKRLPVRVGLPEPRHCTIFAMFRDV